MPDIDQRITDGLQVVANRAPVQSDVWPATHEHVAKRRRQRRTLVGATLVVALLAGGIVTAAAVRRSDAKVVVSNPTDTTLPSKTLGLDGRIDGTLPVISASPTGGLTFAPSAVTVRTGVYALVFRDGANAQHTLAFDNPETLWPVLSLDTYGEVKGSRIFFGHAGRYTFYCTVSGHRAAGMKGVVTVTGPTVTLAQAEAAGTPFSG